VSVQRMGEAVAQTCIGCSLSDKTHKPYGTLAPKESGSDGRGESWMLQGLPHCGRADSAGAPSRSSWELESELSTASSLSVPKLGKRFLERDREAILEARVSFRLALSIVPVVVVITVPVVVPAMVSFAVAVPVVIVFNAAAIPFPITHKEPFAVVARCNPTSSRVWWSSPIALMPPVMPSYGIPITLHQHKLRTRRFWQNPNNPGRRWRPNCNSNGNLSVNC
jgi:hypothetical protein